MDLTQDAQGGKAETHKGTRVMMEADRRAAGPAKVAWGQQELELVGGVLP